MTTPRLSLPSTPATLVRASLLVALTATVPVPPAWSQEAPPSWVAVASEGEQVLVGGVGSGATLEAARKAAAEDAAQRLLSHLLRQTGWPQQSEALGDAASLAASDLLKPLTEATRDVEGVVTAEIRFRVQRSSGELQALLWAYQEVGGLVVGAALTGGIRVRSAAGPFSGVLVVGDELLAIDGTSVTTLADIAQQKARIEKEIHKNRPVEVSIRRYGVVMSVWTQVQELEELQIRHIQVAPTCGPCCHGSYGCEPPMPVPNPMGDKTP